MGPDAGKASLVLDFVCRLLSLTELQHALTISPGMTAMDPKAIRHKMILTSVCAGLVVMKIVMLYALLVGNFSNPALQF